MTFSVLPKYGSIADIRIQQVYFSKDPLKTEWIKELIGLKIEGQMSNLAWIKNRKSRLALEIENAKTEIAKYKEGLQQDKNIDQIRSTEAVVSKIYWTILFKAFGEEMNATKRIKKGAEDIYNSSLNYCYGILYGLIEASLLMVGLDPYIGIYHIIRHDRPVLAFDHIEPFRPWVDRLVIEIMQTTPQDYTYYEDEDMQVNLSIAYRKLLIQNFFDMLEQRSYLNGQRIKRKDHINYLSSKLVSILKAKNYE